jgi:hypothetical protein
VGRVPDQLRAAHHPDAGVIAHYRIIGGDPRGAHLAGLSTSIDYRDDPAVSSGGVAPQPDDQAVMPITATTRRSALAGLPPTRDDRRDLAVTSGGVAPQPDDQAVMPVTAAATAGSPGRVAPQPDDRAVRPVTTGGCLGRPLGQPAPAARQGRPYDWPYGLSIPKRPYLHIYTAGSIPDTYGIVQLAVLRTALIAALVSRLRKP